MAFTSNEDSTIINLKTYNYELWTWRGLNPRPSDYESAALTN